VRVLQHPVPAPPRPPLLLLRRRRLLLCLSISTAPATSRSCLVVPCCVVVAQLVRHLLLATVCYHGVAGRVRLVLPLVLAPQPWHGLSPAAALLTAGTLLTLLLVLRRRGVVLAVLVRPVWRQAVVARWLLRLLLCLAGRLVVLVRLVVCLLLRLRRLRLVHVVMLHVRLSVGWWLVCMVVLHVHCRLHHVRVRVLVLLAASICSAVVRCRVLMEYRRCFCMIVDVGLWLVLWLVAVLHVVVLMLAATRSCRSISARHMGGVSVRVVLLRRCLMMPVAVHLLRRCLMVAVCCGQVACCCLLRRAAVSVVAVLVQRARLGCSRAASWGMSASVVTSLVLLRVMVHCAASLTVLRGCTVVAVVLHLCWLLVVVAVVRVVPTTGPIHSSMRSCAVVGGGVLLVLQHVLLVQLVQQVVVAVRRCKVCRADVAGSVVRLAGPEVHQYVLHNSSTALAWLSSGAACCCCCPCCACVLGLHCNGLVLVQPRHGVLCCRDCSTAREQPHRQHADCQHAGGCRRWRVDGVGGCRRVPQREQQLVEQLCLILLALCKAHHHLLHEQQAGRARLQEQQAGADGAQAKQRGGSRWCCCCCCCAASSIMGGSGGRTSHRQHPACRAVSSTQARVGCRCQYAQGAQPTLV
jgi:hypothetical protein